jgi:Predicted membrane protein
MLKNIKYYLLTATITIGILVFIYSFTSAVGNSFFISDAYEQYLPLFSKLSNILKNGDSFFYNFNGTLGNSFLETFLYYLASPFNLLIILFKDLNAFVITITALKLITASLTAFALFNYLFKDSKIYSIAFALIYTFLTFNIIYSFHIMWLDAIYLFPLILLGINKIIKDNRPILFMISFILSIITNYYFGYMISIFCFIYFNYQLLLENKYKFKNFIKDNIKFIKIILLSLLISSFVLLPIIFTVSNYARGNTTLFNGESIYINLNIFDFFKQFLIGSNIENEFLNPNKFLLYSTVLTIPLLIFFFLNKNISKKEKIFSSTVLFILFISTSCNFINYIWHGFSSPQFFNGRFTFMFSLFILLMCYKSIINIKHITKVQFLINSLILTVLLLLLFFMKLPASDMYINFIFIASYIIILYFLDSEKIFFPLILITVIIIELVTNSIVELDKYEYKNKSIDSTHSEVYSDILKYIYDYDSYPFYRIENNVTDPYNTALRYNFYGIDSFLSTLRQDVSDFFVDVGYSSGSTKHNTVSYYSGTEVIDSLLGIKYHIAFNQKDFNNRYLLLNEYSTKWVDDSDISISIYKNPYALSLGYMVTNDIKTIKKDNNAFKYQNNILSSMSGINKNIFSYIDINEDFEFINTSTKDIYFYTVVDVLKPYNNYYLYLNDYQLTKTEDFEIIKTSNYYDINEKLYIGFLEYDVYAAYYNEYIFDEIINELKNNQLTITEINDSYIKGFVEATENKTVLFTSIAYDDNWDIYVDGKKHNKIKILDTLLAIELEPGEHIIEFKYKPKEFYTGLLISTITILLVTLFRLKRSLIK